MLFFENIFLALNGLRANKIRSLLTMLGIIIGIASVIAITSVGNALTSSTMSSMSDLGATQITLGVQQRSDEKGNEDTEGLVFMDNRSRNVKEEDMMDEDMVRDIFDTFSDRLKEYRLTNSIGEGIIKSGSKDVKVNITGNNNEAMEGADVKMLSGRLFTVKDQEEGKKVAVLSDKVVDEVLKTGYEDALGKEITVILNGEFHHFTVVGVYEFDDTRLSYALSGSDATEMYIPIRTSFMEVHKKELYQSIVLEFTPGTDSDALLGEIQDYANDRYYRNNRNFNVKAFSNASLLQELEKSLQAMSLGISVVAAISLLVGGIGVMNIMLVSIQERTKEIGTRKALGATNSSIRMQFIVEAIVLCTVGGLIGVIVGVGMGYLATVIMSNMSGGGGGAIDFDIPYNGIIVALIFSASVGIFFGYYPANKAAKMNPIDALRYE